MPEKPKIVSFREAAQSLDIASHTLFRMLKKGEIRGAFRVGRLWRFKLGELERIGKISAKRARKK